MKQPIIARTPLRISFAGGGSDIPSFYKRYGGAVLCSSINKYVYVAISSHSIPVNWCQNVHLGHQTMNISNNRDIVECCAKFMNLTPPYTACLSDVYCGVGLGGSSAYIASLLLAMGQYAAIPTSKLCLANNACNVELNLLKRHVGKQDQFATVYGGLNFIEFAKTDEVIVSPVHLSREKRETLNNNLILMYSGVRHNSDQILQTLERQFETPETDNNVRKIASLAYELKNMLETGYIDDFGRILHEGWMIKRRLAKVISNPFLDAFYQKGIESGALGGKLLGAGGGGFILFYVPPTNQSIFRKMMKNYIELPFDFENGGSKIIS